MILDVAGREIAGRRLDRFARERVGTGHYGAGNELRCCAHLIARRSDTDLERSFVPRHPVARSERQVTHRPGHRFIIGAHGSVHRCRMDYRCLLLYIFDEPCESCCEYCSLIE